MMFCCRWLWNTDEMPNVAESGPEDLKALEFLEKTLQANTKLDSRTRKRFLEVLEGFRKMMQLERLKEE